MHCLYQSVKERIDINIADSQDRGLPLSAWVLPCVPTAHLAQLLLVLP